MYWSTLGRVTLIVLVCRLDRDCTVRENLFCSTEQKISKSIMYKK